MKNKFYILALGLMVSACTTQSGSLMSMFDAYDEAEENGRTVVNNTPEKHVTYTMPEDYTAVKNEVEYVPTTVPVKAQPVYNTADQTYQYQVPQTAEFAGNEYDETPIFVKAKPVYNTSEESYQRLRYNVALKAHDADFVTYEYKDVGIEDVAAMAIRYCDEQGRKKASLREIILHQNHHRLATFDCKGLAKKEVAPYIDL